MHQPNLLFPIIALAFWTFAVLLLIPYQRFKAVFSGKLSPGDFRLGESARVPAAVSIPNRNYMNLLELPLLFYVVLILFFVTNKADVVTLGLAWCYVGARVLHSLVHLSYNNVIHRMVFFVASNVLLITLWMRFAIAL